MSLELVYTSAESGLRQGARGFCTVISTSGMPVNLATRLEALSGYRHVYSPQDALVDQNPVNWSHVRLKLGGRSVAVVSRVAAYGVDYSGRTNKLAHHVAVEPSELPLAGPAWLLDETGVMRTIWDGQKATPPAGPKIPTANQPASICKRWQKMTGDAGWGGVVAEAWASRGAKPQWVIYSLQQSRDLLALVNESIALLPEGERWNATFSTYYTNLPPEIDCRLRFVLEGTDEARLAAARGSVLDLTRPGTVPRETPLVELARSGPGNAAPPPNDVSATQSAAAVSASSEAPLIEEEYALAETSVPQRRSSRPPSLSAAKSPPMLPRPATRGSRRLLYYCLAGSLLCLLLIALGIGAASWSRMTGSEQATSKHKLSESADEAAQAKVLKAKKLKANADALFSDLLEFEDELKRLSSIPLDSLPRLPENIELSLPDTEVTIVAVNKMLHELKGLQVTGESSDTDLQTAANKFSEANLSQWKRQLENFDKELSDLKDKESVASQVETYKKNLDVCKSQSLKLQEQGEDKEMQLDDLKSRLERFVERIEQTEIPPGMEPPLVESLRGKVDDAKASVSGRFKSQFAKLAELQKQLDIFAEDVKARQGDLGNLLSQLAVQEKKEAEVNVFLSLVRENAKKEKVLELVLELKNDGELEISGGKVIQVQGLGDADSYQWVTTELASNEKVKHKRSAMSFSQSSDWKQAKIAVPGQPNFSLVAKANAGGDGELQLQYRINSSSSAPGKGSPFSKNVLDNACRSCMDSVVNLNALVDAQVKKLSPSVLRGDGGTEGVPKDGTSLDDIQKTLNSIDKSVKDKFTEVQWRKITEGTVETLLANLESVKVEVEKAIAELGVISKSEESAGNSSPARISIRTNELKKIKVALENVAEKTRKLAEGIEIDLGELGLVKVTGGGVARADVFDSISIVLVPGLKRVERSAP